MRSTSLPAKRKRVYVLIGNEPKEACIERLREVVAWGGEPHAQPYIKLNALRKEPHLRFDWTARDLTDIARISNRWLYRKDVPNFDLSVYRRSAKTSRDERYDPGTGLFA